MLRNALILSTLLVSSVALTGCSSVWTKFGDLSYSMAEFTKPASLRGLSTKSETDAVDITVSEKGLRQTAIGEFIPTEVTYDEEGNAVIDSSPHPCPDGTVLNEENACMFLETETFDFGDELTASVQQPIETGPVPCPDETYLTAENTCSYLETETYDFGDDLMTNVTQPIETGPIPCPDGTYLTAENTCAYLDNEEFDFASKIEVADSETDTATDTTATDTQEFAFNQPLECPKGFVRDANNSCMFLGQDVPTE